MFVHITMPSIESSKDILYIVIAFCILWLTIFISWMMYYCITIIKQVNEMVKDVRVKLNLIESFINLMKEKLEKSSLKELQNAMAVERKKEIVLDSKVYEILKNELGKFEMIV